MTSPRARLKDIIRTRSFGRGEITLASGRKSDFYFNLKPTMLDPEGAALLAELSLDALKDDQIDFIGGLEMGAVPIAGAIAQLSWLKGRPIAAFFARKKPKEHGARLAVEGLAKGENLAGKRIVIVEDVTTTGGSAIKAVDAVKDAGGEVVLVFTMLGRDDWERPVVRAITRDAVRNTDARRFYARCIVTRGDDGRWYADLTGPQGSGILTSMSAANALTIIPEDVPVANPGDEIDVMMLDWEHAPSRRRPR